MNWQTALTVLPTALSAGLFANTHLVFALAMRADRRPAPRAALPRVSILKPLAGRDDGLLDNLRSFADLDYPGYELLLGVASLEDPAVPVARAFLAAHPALDARLVVTSPPGGDVKNPKVAQLIDLSRAASGAVLVVSDANIRVSRGYLRALVAALEPGVGVVSSVIVGAGERTLAAAVDSAQLSAYVAPSVVTAHDLGLWPITVGKSMAMRKRELESIGGFESVAGVLAEDDVLGKRFHARGYRVEVCRDAIENHNAHATWSTVIARHARWAMLRRLLTPLGFAFELLLSPLLVAVAVALVAPSRLAFVAVAASLALHCLGAFASLTRLGSRHAFALAALEPLRVATMFLCWCLGVVRSRVDWRGNSFTLAAGSRLVPMTAASPGRLARFATFARSLLAGGAATIGDLATLALAIRVIHLTPAAASIPALCVGAVVQFFGNRHFAFRAGSGPLGRQAVLFLGSEILAMALNAALYDRVAARLPLTLATAVVARLVTTNMVFLGFSYPVWKRVFRGGAALAPSANS